MNLGNTLSVVIPLVVFGYALWLAIDMLRKRRKCGAGGCAGCPLRGGCEAAGRMEAQKKQESGDTRHERQD